MAVPGSFDLTQSLDGSFDTTVPLAASSVFDFIGADAGLLAVFSMSDDRSAYAGVDMSIFTVATDALGDIEFWVLEGTVGEALFRSSHVFPTDLGVTDFAALNGAGLDTAQTSVPGQWATVPEPSTALMMGLGLIGLTRAGRQR